MSTANHPMVGFSILWLISIALLPAWGFAGAVEIPSQTPAQALVSPPVNLQVAPPVDLKFQAMDLQFRVEDVKGAVQALAMKETPTEVKIELSGDVLCDFDKADIRPEAEPALHQVLAIIKQYPRASVAIHGYTDAKGADAYNLRLSDKRAAAVKSWLVEKGG